MENNQIERISALMQSKGINIMQLAESCGISHMTIRRILNGETQSTTASSIGIEAYNCMWGAKDGDKEIMFKDMRDVTLKRPKEIIDILKNNK